MSSWISLVTYINFKQSQQPSFHFGIIFRFIVQLVMQISYCLLISPYNYFFFYQFILIVVVTIFDISIIFLQ